jgi:amino acid transporter
VAILILLAIVLVLVFSGDIGQLASATSVLLLSVFVLVNASLLILKSRAAEPHGSFEIPAWVPMGGIAMCLVMLWHAKIAALLTASALLAGIAVLYFIMRPKEVVADI